MVGLVGTREEADKLKSRLTDFLNDSLKLTLSPSKTKITNLSYDRAKFLGVHFWIPKSVQAKLVAKYNARGKRMIKSRVNK